MRSIAKRFYMLLRAAPLGLLLAMPGCTQVQLARSTINQGSTLSDLQRRLVLDNLAMFYANPDSLAWHVKLQGGLVQVADQGSLSLQGTILTNPNLVPGAVGQRGVVGQWNVEPAVDVDELEALQLAYQLAINPQNAEARLGVYQAIGETAVSYHIVLSESALNELIAALAADESDRRRYAAQNQSLHAALRDQASIIEQLREADAQRLRQPPGATGPQVLGGGEQLKAMLEARVLTAENAQAWVALTTESRVLTEDKIIKLTQEVCGAELHFVPHFPIDGRRERNVAIVDQAQEKIDKLFQLLDDEIFQRPWLFCGEKRDVPRDACDVGRYGRCFVWAAPGASRTLTEFVLIVLALAPSGDQDISGGGSAAPSGGAAYSPALTN